MREFVAASLDELRVLWREHFQGETSCFRGQSDNSWGLVPTVFRGLNDIPRWEDEMDYIHNSERDCHREFRDDMAQEDLGFKDTLKWLAFEQHHGAPTRLLDWTHQISIAAFFAASGSTDKDAAIFGLDLAQFPFHRGLGRQLPNGGFDLDRIRNYCGGIEPFFAQSVSRPIDSVTGRYLDEEKPIPESTFVIWRPPRSHYRLRSQQGLFGFYLSFDAYDFEVDLLPFFTRLETTSGIEFLGKIILPRATKTSILLDLHRENVDEYSIYGGPDNLGRRVSRAHHNRLSYLNPKP